MKNLIFLLDCVDDEDSVLIIIAEKLGHLCNYVGSAENTYVLLKPLELLVCGEESSIRDKALVSAQEIVKKMNENQILKYLFPLINKLANREWFTARSAAAALAPLAYDRVNDKCKSEITTILSRLSNDTAPTVRRSVAKSLPTIARSANANTLTEITELYKFFAKDDQDSIRIQIIPVSAVLAEYLSWDLKVCLYLFLLLIVLIFKFCVRPLSLFLPLSYLLGIELGEFVGACVIILKRFSLSLLILLDHLVVNQLPSSTILHLFMIIS